MHMHMSAHLGRDTCAHEYIHDWDMCAHEYTHIYTCVHISTYMPVYMLGSSRDGLWHHGREYGGVSAFRGIFVLYQVLYKATHIHTDTEKHTHTHMCSVISTVI